MTIQARSPTAFVVDDDEAVRSSLRMLLKSLGIPAVTYGSASTTEGKLSIPERLFSSVDPGGGQDSNDPWASARQSSAVAGAQRLRHAHPTARRPE